MPPEIARIRPKVLMIGAHGLVVDNVRVLLRTMGCDCVIGSTIKKAVVLLEKEKPDAAILDTQLLASSPPNISATAHKIAVRLQGRVVVLTREERGSQLPVLEAYSLPRVHVDLVFQELWPCLDSLLHGNTAPRQAMHRAQIVFDSSLQPLAAGVRTAQSRDRWLLYECGDVMVDLWLEPQGDSQHIRLMGQILREAKSKSQFHCAPVVLQSKAEPIEATTTNELGEFQLDFHPHPNLRLEIGVRENHWVSLPLPDSNDSERESTEEFRSSR
jgi:hypothetical protein